MSKFRVLLGAGLLAIGTVSSNASTLTSPCRTLLEPSSEETIKIGWSIWRTGAHVNPANRYPMTLSEVAAIRRVGSSRDAEQARNQKGAAVTYTVHDLKNYDQTVLMIRHEADQGVLQDPYSELRMELEDASSPEEKKQRFAMWEFERRKNVGETVFYPPQVGLIWKKKEAILPENLIKAVEMFVRGTLGRADLLLHREDSSGFPLEKVTLSPGQKRPKSLFEPDLRQMRLEIVENGRTRLDIYIDLGDQEESQIQVYFDSDDERFRSDLSLELLRGLFNETTPSRGLDHLEWKSVVQITLQENFLKKGVPVLELPVIGSSDNFLE